MLVAVSRSAEEFARAEALRGFELSAGRMDQAIAVRLFHWHCGRVEPPDARFAAALSEAVADTGVTGLLYRDGLRHRREIVEAVLPGANGASSNARVRLERGGTYVVFGGRGGLGRHLCAHLRTRWNANVVVCSRSADAQPSGTGEPLSLVADPTDRHAVDQALDRAFERFGTVDGVFHLAGSLPVDDAAAIDPVSFAHILRPKIDGTRAVFESARHRGVRFVCCFGSMAAMVGDGGELSYSIANRYQHALAASRQARSTELVCIDWPAWADGGMRPPAMQTYLQTTGQRALGVAEGMALLEASLAAGHPAIGWLAMAPGRVAGILASASAAEPASARPGGEPAPAAGPSLGTSEAAVTDALLRMASDILATPIDLLNTAENISRFGFDSVLLTRFAAEIARWSGVPVAPSVFFSHGSIAALARHLAPLHRGARPAPANSTSAASADSTVTDARPVQHDLQASPVDDRLAIAVIGMSGQVGAAASIDAFWAALREGRELFDLAIDRARATLPGASTAFVCARIADVDAFDADFFELTPLEAEQTDPRQRRLLQETWNALEDAALAPAELARLRAGVFVGAEQGDYQRIVADAPSPLANNDAMLAARIAYSLDVSGAAITLNTACSSGLVAAHQACMALSRGELDVAIVASANLLLSGQLDRILAAASLLSPSGRCRAFSARADGIVPGEAVVSMVLVRLEDARRRGDPVRALVRASGVNYDGRTNGVASPSGRAQADLIADTHARHGIDATRIAHLVAHGTGTRIGDPVEIDALVEAFRRSAGHGGDCALTSPKSNVGHTFAASGLVGLIALTRSLEAQEIPPTLHADPPSDYVDWNASPFRLNTTLRPWPHDRAYGAVSAFGMSGTNAHMVLEAAPVERTRPDGARPGVERVFVLSAKSPGALHRRQADLLAFLQSDAGAVVDPMDLAWTLLVCRAPMSHRFATVAASLPALIDTLRTQLASGAARDALTGVVDPRKAPDAKAAMVVNDLREAAQGFCSGFMPDASALFAHDRPRRLRLPGYPFEAKRHWVGRPGQPANAHRSMRFLLPRWTPQPIVAIEQVECAVLVVSDRETRALANRLGSWFRRCVVIEVEDGRVSPPDGDLAHIDGVIDLLGMSARSMHDMPVLGLLQRCVAAARTRQRQARKPRFLAVTAGFGSPEHWGRTAAASHGAALHRMLQAEYPGIVSRHVDLPAGGMDAETVVATIAREFYSSDESNAVRHADGVRQVACFEAVSEPVFDLLASANGRGPLSNLSSGDRILITGGFGGLGYACARHLVEQHGLRELVLTTRSAVDARDPARQAQIEALRGLGARVQVLALDFVHADDAEVRKAIATLGPVHGVVHAAGCVDRRTLAFVAKSEAGIADILAPKVSGWLRLASALEHAPLKFVALFSSISALVPGMAVGQSDYAAANAFLDVFAESARFSCPVYSLQWPAWRGIGMAGEATAAYRATGLEPLDPDAGLALFDKVLDQSVYRVLAPVLVDDARFGEGEPLRARPAAPPRLDGSDRASAKGGADGAMRAWLAQLFQQELKLERDIDVHARFQDYGLDSILLTQLLRSTSDQLGLALDPSLVYEFPTLAGLASRIEALGARAPATAAATTAHGHPRGLDVAVSEEAVRAERAETATIDEDIVVVGLSCRFAGAPSLDAYWSLLREGRSAIAQVPASRWTSPGRPWLALLDDVDRFDPGFFRISPEDAAAMDPQARILLEEGLRAACHAGYTAQELAGANIGVYVGARSLRTVDPMVLANTRNPILASGQNYLAANVSQFFDLRGPCLVVDTACSSALVAMELAASALRRRTIDAAFVGGATVFEDDRVCDLFRQRGLLSDGPEFRVFDQRARGIVPGEGAGMVLLKTRSRALADGDGIYAVVRAIATNNNGRTAGPATPSIEQQRNVMAAALAQGGRTADEVQYIEVNGSGSEVTDLLELKAIAAVYGREGAPVCHLGSMKPNIGHPMCAEGLAAFIKLVLMLNQREIPPFLSGQQPLAHFPLEETRFAFARKVLPLAARTVALNCFADGGTNVHVVLEAGDAAPGQMFSASRTTSTEHASA